jgi:hypothetical protein
MRIETKLKRSRFKTHKILRALKKRPTTAVLSHRNDTRHNCLKREIPYGIGSISANRFSQRPA